MHLKYPWRGPSEFMALSGKPPWIGYSSLTVLIAMAFSSCASLNVADRDMMDVPLPEAYSIYPTSEAAPDRWWESFESEELDRLVDSALSDNFTIQQAIARIRQAGAIASQTRALRQPQIGYDGDASLSRRRTELGGGESSVDAATRRLNALNSLLGATGALGNAQNLTSAAGAVGNGRSAVESLLAPSPATSITTNTDSYGIGLTAGYEVDVWGRLRADEAAALQLLEASRDDTYAVMQSVAGQVALTWLSLLEIQQVLEVVRGQLETNETNLGLIELRYRNGLATILDVYQQRQAVAETEAAIPLLEARYALQQHTLAVLLGLPPRSDLGLTETSFTDPGALPEYGIPADLLARRPDVRAAARRLRSADWEVVVARADRLPRLSISAGLSTDAESLGALFDNWLMQLAAGVTGPIFDGGRRKAEVERVQAVVDERLAAYRDTVIGAVAEVEDALILMERQESYRIALDRQLSAARDSHREALGRYRKGLTDYLPVLTALRNLQALERDVVEAEHDVLIYRVQLHLALGGDWMETHVTVNKGTNS